MRRLALVAALLAAPATALANSNIVIINNNAPGVGFNDPTPVAPVGGNPGTTLGQQRLNAFQFAADQWAPKIDSAVTITILASFEPLNCTANSATLGSAGTLTIWSFSTAPVGAIANTWYGKALTNKLLGADVASTFPDIRARFNSNLGAANCLAGITWYLGFDLNHGNNIDLVTVLEHEFAHGFGFQQFASVTSGTQINDMTDAYGRKLFDKTVQLHWNEMTNAQRKASAINPRNVVWTGSEVTAEAPNFVHPGTPLAHIASATLTADFAVGAASFGAPLNGTGVTGTVVIATDDANAGGPSTTDACTTITNAAAVAGHIALVDRGSCGFVVKAKNVQNAGAIGMIVADNAAGFPPPGMSGTDPTVVISSVRITLADGNSLKAALAAGTVTASLLTDNSVLAGADRDGKMLLYTPVPVAPGSTISHWDTIAFPNLLMEPAINGDLTHSVDLTLPLLHDVGWYPDADIDNVPDSLDQCLGSDLSPTVTIGTCDSGATNDFFSSPGALYGCSVADLVNRCESVAHNHGAYVSCVTKEMNPLKKAGILTDAEFEAIMSCAGSSGP